MATLRKKFDWEKGKPLPRITLDDDSPDISNADLRKQYEKELDELNKDPITNAEKIAAISDLLRIS